LQIKQISDFQFVISVKALYQASFFSIQVFKPDSNLFPSASAIQHLFFKKKKVEAKIVDVTGTSTQNF